jgi:UDP-N-acetylmuramyl pentapeptide phosphotransferase/UDP-N-acetylglucosamine-1-phosphate transferase
MFSAYQILIPALLAFCGTLWIHPKILKIAIMKNIVDNPDARKLQRKPVPVMGGIAVFFGILIGLCSYQTMISLCCSPIAEGLCTSQAMLNSTNAFMLMAAMLVMLYIGTIDDILDLSAGIRFLIEILIVCWLMYQNKVAINCFWGVWGIELLPTWVALPLTVVSCVGIINSINLIDGVNGLSSGFCFMASVLFAIAFYHSGNVVMMTLAVSTAGAIIPFFLHNVFGYNTRMFIGDGGTLVIGTLMSMFATSILHDKSGCIGFMHDGMGLLPFTIAVLSLPVFDTVRVMMTRIFNGRSPFSPDKTHLHHMFIDLGFSHIGTTVSILFLNLFIVAAWYTSYRLGASIDTQLYIVFALGISFTFVLYSYAEGQLKKNGKGLRVFKAISDMLLFEKKDFWKKLQKTIDSL